MTPGSPEGEVLFVTSSFPRWRGDSTTPFIHHLAQDLRALGWDVQVLAPHAPGAARAEVLDGVPVRRFRYLWPASLERLCYDGGALVRLRTNRWLFLAIPFLVLAQLVSVSRRLGCGRVEIVHSHWILPQAFTAGLAARLFRRRPHVATAHGSDVFALQGRIPTFFKRLALRSADAITVNSTATERAVAGIAPCARKLTRIPMGAAASVLADTGAEALRARFRKGAGPLLVFVGRLVPEKGVSDLLEAVALMAGPLPDVAVLVIGDGPQRAALEREARERGIDSRASFLGWLDPAEVRRHLSASDIFVGPSRPAGDGTLEAQGLAIAEAMLAGVPVVATAIGGIPDAIRHEETGLLVGPHNPREIAAAVCRLAADAALSERLAGSARSHAGSEFTRQVSARRFSELYRRVLEASAAQEPAREKK